MRRCLKGHGRKILIMASLVLLIMGSLRGTGVMEYEIATSALDGVKQEDDSSCRCSMFPVWDDIPFARDNDTQKPEHRATVAQTVSLQKYLTPGATLRWPSGSLIRASVFSDPSGIREFDSETLSDSTHWPFRPSFQFSFLEL